MLPGPTPYFKPRGKMALSGSDGLGPGLGESSLVQQVPKPEKDWGAGQDGVERVASCLPTPPPLGKVFLE